MPTNSSLGSTIRELRLKAEITLRELARRVDISPAHLSDVEHDRRSPSDELLGRIADKLSDVGAEYEKLRLLKPLIEEDLERWYVENHEVRVLLREAKDSGLSARELLDRLRTGQEKDQG